MPSTQHVQHRRHQLSMLKVCSRVLTGSWTPWSATPDVWGCTTTRLARKERQFQHVRALCGPCEPPLHGSRISPQTDTCVERKRLTNGKTVTYNHISNTIHTKIHKSRNNIHECLLHLVHWQHNTMNNTVHKLTNCNNCEQQCK